MTEAPRKEIEDLVDELERVAGRLRDGDLERDEAAAVVERCAELAGRIGGQLEREARTAPGRDGPSGQEQLL